MDVEPKDIFIAFLMFALWYLCIAFMGFAIRMQFECVGAELKNLSDKIKLLRWKMGK